jgi:hypothetical protein
MPQKTSFISLLADFLAERPALAKLDPACLLAAIQLGHEAPEEMLDLVELVNREVPHLLDENDIKAALTEAELIRLSWGFPDEEPTSLNGSIPPGTSSRPSK